MNKQKWYNTQHVSSEDLDQIYLDCEQLTLNHVYDFHYSGSQFVLANPKYSISSMQVQQQQFASLTVQVSGGVAYQDQKRVEISSTQQFTIANPPIDYGSGFTVTRIDLIYLTIDQIDKYPFSIDFIDANRNIYQDTKYTRSETIYTIKQATGTYNPIGGVKPAIPIGGIALAYIHLRDGTNKIYNNDTSQLNEGYIEDARVLVLP